jgi:hypothetical protein
MVLDVLSYVGFESVAAKLAQKANMHIATTACYPFSDLDVDKKVLNTSPSSPVDFKWQ